MARLRVALLDHEGADQVGAEAIVHDSRALGERRFGIEHGGQRFDVEPDQLRRVFGRMAAVGHDHRHGFADVPDLVVGEQRLLRIDELVLDLRRPFARQRKLRVRHGRHHLHKLRAAERVDHAGRRRGARQIDRLDAPVRDRAAHEHGMQHVRQFEIGDELPAAGEQAPVFAARDGAADKGGLYGFIHQQCRLCGGRRSVCLA